MKIKALLILFLSCSQALFSGLNQYEGIWAGASFMSSKIDCYDVIFDPGFTGGAMYGIKWPYGISTEIEGCYRQNHISDIKKGKLSSKHHGHMEIFAGFVNLLYDIPLQTRIIPVVGVGAGWEYERANLRARGLDARREDSAFISQVIGGLYYRYNRCFSFFLTGRYYFFDEDVHSGIVALGLVHHLY